MARLIVFTAFIGDGRLPFCGCGVTRLGCLRCKANGLVRLGMYLAPLICEIFAMTPIRSIFVVAEYSGHFECYAWQRIVGVDRVSNALLRALIKVNGTQARTMKRARDIREQLVGLMERVEIQLESCGDDDVPLRKAITSGFFYNVAQLTKPAEGAYKTVKQRHTVFIHPSSGVFCRLCPPPCNCCFLWR
jgi:hypothetical protein